MDEERYSALLMMMRYVETELRELRETDALFAQSAAQELLKAGMNARRLQPHTTTPPRGTRHCH